MKRIVALLLVSIFLISMVSFLVGCGKEKDELQRYRDAAAQAEENYQRVKERNDNLRKDLEDYSRLYDKVFGSN